VELNVWRMDGCMGVRWMNKPNKEKEKGSG